MSDLVVVTGTSSGVGRATAARLLRDGFRVVGIARRPVDPSQLAAAGDETGGGYAHVCADLSDLDALPALAKRVLAEHGEPFGLVNNAAAGTDGLLPTMHNSEIRALLGLDLASPILLTKYLVRPMISRRRGRVVNVSSIVASTGFRGLSVYGAAKAGLEGFTRSLARDLGQRGVTVNAVAPGFLDTEMTESLGSGNLERIRSRSPLGRFATADEVAGAIAHLMAPEAAGTTGTVMTVDAGSTA
ncbi:MAG: 3-oxoacyl-[acyl-carrier protein] reductase [uncultured Quadrisphaera sp.]|uniref:3-oxoacyl-[acyl-carrier protein] reductase n=1 Tax=uncultured Quadrisphaera sp. TaxID=904978 RepID=A0A6J4Q763_9ACTN|nr:MAG: 3-oxoacyl-[acyl-carrier protein] reductase [uncultured Quadrisphaera sp.]